jgi:hypothetical protein
VASYDIAWLTGVALAPEQVTYAATPVAEVRDEGMIFMHGLSVGMEARF